MRVLVACEESQRVTSAFRAKGHEAYSCDILDCSGGHPEWHIKQSCIPLLQGYCVFYTLDGAFHHVPGSWDLIIAHPPCTYLTCTGNRWFDVSKYGDKAIQRFKLREEAIAFFERFLFLNCPRVAIENPVGVMSTYYRKPDQIIQPFWFGDGYEKRTCLWLKGLPLLKPTNVVSPEPRVMYKKSMPLWYAKSFSLPKEQRSLVRSKTFPGFALAMAEQWG